jgi:hypothetical protein
MALCQAETSASRARGVRLNGGGYSLSLSQAAQLSDQPFNRETTLAPQTTKCSTICRQLVFPGLWMFIGLVSAFDTYLTVKFQDCLMFHEVNPLAVMLLRLDGWDPSLLIGLKFLGSVLALGFLAALHLYNRRLGLMVTSGLASFQLWLLGYLVFA